MSVHSTSLSAGGDPDEMAVPVGARCFYCAFGFGALDGYGVLWNGAHGTALWLHTPCTVELTRGLLRDVHEILLVTGAASR